MLTVSSEPVISFSKKATPFHRICLFGFWWELCDICNWSWSTLDCCFGKKTQI